MANTRDREASSPRLKGAVRGPRSSFATATLSTANTNNEPDEVSVSVSSAAHRLGCDTSTIRALVRKGLLIAFRVGKTERPKAIRIKLWSIREWETNHAVAASNGNASKETTRQQKTRRSGKLDEAAAARLRAIGA